MVINFKTFIASVLLVSKRENLNQFADMLNNIKFLDLNESTSQMTISVEQVINIVQDAFKKIIQELESISKDLQEHIKNDNKRNEKLQNEISDLKRDNEALKKQQNAAVEIMKSSNSPTNDKPLSVNIPTETGSIMTKPSSRSDDSIDKPVLEKRRSSFEKEDFKKKLKENEIKISELEQVIKKLIKEAEEVKVNNTVLEKSIQLADEDVPSIMFTKLDAEHNAKRLKRAYNKGIVSENEYQVR